jgi:hypothetical protein
VIPDPKIQSAEQYAKSTLHHAPLTTIPDKSNTPLETIPPAATKKGQSTKKTTESSTRKPSLSTTSKKDHPVAKKQATASKDLGPKDSFIMSK